MAIPHGLQDGERAQVPSADQHLAATMQCWQMGFHTVTCAVPHMLRCHYAALSLLDDMRCKVNSVSWTSKLQHVTVQSVVLF